MKRPRVLLADDHRMVAEGLKSLLSDEFELAGVVEDGRAMIDAARKLRPDVIVADITMPHLNGIDALVRLKRDDVQIPVVFLTMHVEVAYARRALEGGAAGYVLKHSAPDELITAIRAALAGKTYVSPAVAGDVLRVINQKPERADDPVASLTPRQREILQLLTEGRSAKEIGDTLAISARTVEFHKYQLMEKLNLHTNAELVHFSLKHGIADI
jgi:DNA-binding NarL/FixJ family response regulator